MPDEPVTPFLQLVLGDPPDAKPKKSKQRKKQKQRQPPPEPIQTVAPAVTVATDTAPVETKTADPQAQKYVHRDRRTPPWVNRGYNRPDADRIITSGPWKGHTVRYRAEVMSMSDHGHCDDPDEPPF